MKITIEAETDVERAKMAEPWVRANVERCAVAGVGEPMLDAAGKPGNREFGHLHGPWLLVKADLVRMTLELDQMAAQETAVNGALIAHNMIVEQAQHAQALGKLVNGRGLRIVQP